MSLSPGVRLGSYEIVAPIGAGGMGEVYRARDTKLNRDVAIKVLPDLFALDRDHLARSEREAQTLAVLNHPHIAQITRITTTTAGDVVLLPLKGGEPRVLVSTPAYTGGPQISSDGKWITYSSNLSGRMEVYLRRIDGPERHPVSTAGGVGGMWTPDGKRIVFRSRHQFLAVDLTDSAVGVKLSPPKVLFDRRYAFGPNVTIPNYSLSRDGREFLVVSAGAGHLSLILNWLKLR